MIGTVEFPTPKELSKISSKKREELLRQEKQKIITEMVNAAEKGDFKVYFSEYISLPLKQELKAQGYNVKSCCNEWHCGDMITWN